MVLPRSQRGPGISPALVAVTRRAARGRLRGVRASTWWRAVLLATVLCAPDAAALPTPTVTPSSGASAACASCHAAEYEAWHGSDHDRAMMLASDPGAVQGNFDDAVFARDGVRARFFRRRGGYFVELTEKGSDKPEIHEIGWTFGIFPLQQFLVATEGGRVQALTIAWDARPRATGGQRWYSLHEGSPEPPPDDPMHWRGPAFRWNSMCADCHSTGLVRGFDPARGVYETRYDEIDVGCRACHAPHGSKGADTASARAAATPAASAATSATNVRKTAPASTESDSGPDDGKGGARRWIMNNDERGIAHLATPPPPGTRSEIETCAPCHARRASLAPADPAHAPFLDAHRPALLDAGLYEVDGQMRDEVYVWGSFLQSRMHAAGVVCSDCHDPHSLKLRAEGNALCGRCHLPERFDVAAHHLHPVGSPGARCVNCHMPTRTYMGVDARHDHGLRVPRPDLAQTLGVPEPCTSCHTDRDAAWAARVLTERHGPPGERRPLFPAVLAAVRDGDPQAPALLAALARDPAESALARATALSLLPPETAPGVIPLIEQSAQASESLLRLGAALALAGLPPSERIRIGAPLLSDPRRAIRLEAASALADVPRNTFEPAALAALESGLAELQKAHRYTADEPGSHLNQGLLAQRSGDPAAAEKHYREALRIAPWFVPAWVNLADLARVRGDDGAGEEILRRAARAVPDSADVQSALGLTLVRRGRRDEALRALEQASALAPDDPHHAWLLAIAFDSSDRAADARRVATAALARHPRHAGLRALAGH